jgi:hypothetical protein
VELLAKQAGIFDSDDFPRNSRATAASTAWPFYPEDAVQSPLGQVRSSGFSALRSRLVFCGKNAKDSGSEGANDTICNQRPHGVQIVGAMTRFLTQHTGHNCRLEQCCLQGYYKPIIEQMSPSERVNASLEFGREIYTKFAIAFKEQEQARPFFQENPSQCAWIKKVFNRFRGRLIFCEIGLNLVVHKSRRVGGLQGLLALLRFGLGAARPPSWGGNSITFSGSSQEVMSTIGRLFKSL